MIAILLGAVIATMLSGIVWLLIGSRLKLSGDPRQNDVLNLLVYMALAFFPTFLLVLWLIA